MYWHFNNELVSRGHQKFFYILISQNFGKCVHFQSGELFQSLVDFNNVVNKIKIHQTTIIGIGRNRYCIALNKPMCAWNNQLLPLLVESHNHDTNIQVAKNLI